MKYYINDKRVGEKEFYRKFRDEFSFYKYPKGPKVPYIIMAEAMASAITEMEAGTSYKLKEIFSIKNQ